MLMVCVECVVALLDAYGFRCEDSRSARTARCARIVINVNSMASRASSAYVNLNTPAAFYALLCVPPHAHVMFRRSPRCLAHV